MRILSTSDIERSGRPVEDFTPELNDATDDLVKNDRI